MNFATECVRVAMWNERQSLANTVLRKIRLLIVHAVERGVVLEDEEREIRTHINRFLKFSFVADTLHIGGMPVDAVCNSIGFSMDRIRSYVKDAIELTSDLQEVRRGTFLTSSDKAHLITIRQLELRNMTADARHKLSELQGSINVLIREFSKNVGVEL